MWYCDTCDFEFVFRHDDGSATEWHMTIILHNIYGSNVKTHWHIIDGHLQLRQLLNFVPNRQKCLNSVPRVKLLEPNSVQGVKHLYIWIPSRAPNITINQWRGRQIYVVKYGQIIFKYLINVIKYLSYKLYNTFLCSLVMRRIADHSSKHPNSV